MESDSDRDHRSHRRKRGDGDGADEPERKRAHRNNDYDKPRRRDRSSERDNRRHSRTPDVRRHRPRDRDGSRDRERERERERDNARDREKDGKSERRKGAPEKDQRKDHGDEVVRDYTTSKRRQRSLEQYNNSPRKPSQRGAVDDSDNQSRGPSSNSRRSLAPFKRSGPLPSQGDSFAISKGEAPEKPKEKPNFGNTGLLAAASNTVAQADGSTITLKYHEPPEARKPAARDRWTLFVFKGSDIVDTVELGARSCWLVGRETAVVDLLAEHPSISKQHAVVQFRYTEKRDEFGDKLGKVKPYLIDLESANGTMLNGEKVPRSRYLELRDKDMIQFGLSTREYVLMLAPRE